MKKTLSAPRPPQPDWPAPVEAPLAPVLTPAESRRAWLVSLLATGIVFLLGWVLGRWAPAVLIGPWATGLATVLLFLTGGTMIPGHTDHKGAWMLHTITAVSLLVLSANFLSALGWLP